VAIDTDGKVANRYNIMYVPTLFIVDREGVVRYVHMGLTEEAVLASEVEQLLRQTTRT